MKYDCDSRKSKQSTIAGFNFALVQTKFPSLFVFLKATLLVFSALLDHILICHSKLVRSIEIERGRNILTVNLRHQTESHRMSRILLPIGSRKIMSVLLCDWRTGGSLCVRGLKCFKISLKSKIHNVRISTSFADVMNVHSRLFFSRHWVTLHRSGDHERWSHWKYFIKRFINLHEKMTLHACDQTTEANHRYGARQKATAQNLHLTQGWVHVINLMTIRSHVP